MTSGGSDGKVSAYNAGDPGSIPGSGRSPGEGNGNPLQYSCLEKISWMEEPGRLQSMGSQRVRHDLVTSLSLLLIQQYSSWAGYVFYTCEVSMVIIRKGLSIAAFILPNIKLKCSN